MDGLNLFFFHPISNADGVTINQVVTTNNQSRGISPLLANSRIFINKPYYRPSYSSLCDMTVF